MESLCRRASALLPDELGLWLETAWEYRATRLLVGLALLRLGLNLYTSHKRRRRRAEWASVGRDVVVLHQFSRAPSCPNISPFAIKVETFLRATNTRYVVDDSQPFGPLGKCPWITLNGHEYADSSLILDVLSSQLEARLPVQCDEQRLAAGRAFQVMLEEHTAWCVFFKRYSLDKMRYVWSELPRIARQRMPFMKYTFPRSYARRAREQGIGRFTEPQVLQALERDLRALSAFLGDRQFFLGETVSDLDCCVFGMVCQLLYVSGPYLEFMTRNKCGNLVRHHERIRELYWPDWDQCLEQ
ncbi:Failed axon connections [Amphibalanus amphitrite]|uniref:Failed axon connections n=1 Tax=Amphibalanus amphitrite TaxID=1232801 RepID=A0A6A4UXP6_AMPAM|nr:Failed axon connections [Amphibalanus amphitrite]